MKSARARQASVLAAVETALAEHQPHLEIREESPRLIIEGLFVLSGPEGTFDHFEVKIEVDANFPLAEPKVIETAGRIPHRAERHVNADGSCCLGVWERWLIDAENTSFGSFLKGPAHDFFLSQWFFENTGKWRLGERPHGTTGMLEAYAEVLGVKPKKSAVVSRLVLLTKPWPKGHWLCPCGSGQIIRRCHQNELWALHERVPPHLAKQMLRRLGGAIEGDRNRQEHANAILSASFPLPRLRRGLAALPIPSGLLKRLR